MSAPSSAPSGACAGIRTRYECRELSDTQRTALFDAFKRLMTGGQYTKFVDWHVSVTSTAHGVPEFLPWHREYLRRLEMELGVDLCYWDWASDAQVPDASPMLMPGWGGSNGAGNCIRDGFWGDWTYEGDCISTQWDGSNGGIGAFHSIDYIAKVIQDNNSYDSFRVTYEGAAHARVHNGLGGMFSKMTSPANPTFFFHHCNVDRHWAIWQWAHPDQKTDYPKSLSTQLPVFNIPVSQVMDTQGPGYCYTYSNMDIISTGRAQVGLLQRRSLAEPEAERELDRADHLVRLHRRTGCGNTDPTSNFAAAPCDEDRTNLVDLRDVRPAPEWWIKMEGLNCTEVRRNEAEHTKYITALNRLPGYVSPSALYNRPKLLERVLEKAPSDAKFYMYEPGTTNKYEVNMCETFRANPTEGVQKLRAACEEHYKPAAYEDLQPQLEKLVGCSLANSLIHAGKRHANRPYEYRPEDHKNDTAYGDVSPAHADEDDVCPAGYELVDDDDDSGYGKGRGHRRHRSRGHRRSRRRDSRRHRRHHREEL
jgi:tyrosinase